MVNDVNLEWLQIDSSPFMGLGEYGDQDSPAVNYWMFEYSSDQVALLTAQLGLTELSKLRKVKKMASHNLSV